MQIGKLARLSKESAHTIRYYEKVGLLPRVARTVGGYRSYPIEMVERLQFIRRAQALSLSLTEIGEILSLIDAKQCPCGRVRQLLRARLKELERHIEQLETLKSRINKAVKSYQHPSTRGGGPSCPVVDRQFFAGARAARPHAP